MGFLISYTLLIRDFFNFKFKNLCSHVLRLMVGDGKSAT